MSVTHTHATLSNTCTIITTHAYQHILKCWSNQFSFCSFPCNQKYWIKVEAGLSPMNPLSISHYLSVEIILLCLCLSLMDWKYFWIGPLPYQFSTQGSGLSLSNKKLQVSGRSFLLAVLFSTTSLSACWYLLLLSWNLVVEFSWTFFILFNLAWIMSRFGVCFHSVHKGAKVLSLFGA